MNVISLLSFNAPNKTDAIVVERNYGVPIRIQNSIREQWDEISKLREENKHSFDYLPFFEKAYEKTFHDGRRSKEYLAAKKFVTSRLIAGRGEYNFTDDQINELVKFGATRSPSELVDRMFSGLDDKQRNRIASSARALLNAIGVQYQGDVSPLFKLDYPIGEEYSPPQSDAIVINKINKYVPNADFQGSRLTSEQKKQVRFLRGNLNLGYFCREASSFKEPIDRTLLESEFIRSTYNKLDLTPEDISLYIMLSAEHVRAQQMKEIINSLTQNLKNALAGEEKSNLVFNNELKNRETALKDIQANINKLTDQLTGSRKTRVEHNTMLRQSLVPILKTLADEENRKRLLRRIEAYEENGLKKEIEKLEDMPDQTGEVWGIGVHEIMNFTYTVLDS